MSSILPRSSWQIMCDSVHALLMREIKTRFGSNRLGYFWAIAEPIAQAAVLGDVFPLLGPAPSTPLTPPTKREG